METATMSRRNALIISLTGDDADEVHSALLLRRDAMEVMLAAATCEETREGIRARIARVNHALASTQDYL